MRGAFILTTVASQMRKATHPIDISYSILCDSLSGSSSNLQMVHVQQRAFNISETGVGALSCHLFNLCLF